MQDNTAQIATTANNTIIHVVSVYNRSQNYIIIAQIHHEHTANSHYNYSNVILMQTKFLTAIAIIAAVILVIITATITLELLLLESKYLTIVS